jgi:hypothetical protein
MMQSPMKPTIIPVSFLARVLRQPSQLGGDHAIVHGGYCGASLARK